MNFTYETFTKIRPLTEHLKYVLACYGGKVPPFKGYPIFTWDMLVEYLGKLLDIEGNRILFLKLSGVAATVKTVLRDEKYKLLVKAIKEYNPSLYGSL
ncbi:MAG: hypothetical protein LBK83_10940 [Treponema sp.]|jgi:hypothetical protein|nr:hypothetical protein [Treponema sp.]